MSGARAASGVFSPCVVCKSDHPGGDRKELMDEMVPVKDNRKINEGGRCQGPSSKKLCSGKQREALLCLRLSLLRCAVGFHGLDAVH